MLFCFCKSLLREEGAVIKYFCKNRMPPKEIREDFMETLKKESPSYSTVKKMGSRVYERERDR